MTGNNNVIQEIDAFANSGNGISASGAANTLNKNIGGDRGKGNGGAGFLVSGGSSLSRTRRSPTRATGSTC